ncbi:hypothetical protein EVAR_93266_1 [Eumeta japonica]|uniref:Uncharacterized protein n=1 Tax=Eumeta variegata TaxID=151549 RepID=A0A4C1TXU1_EUMVA|nr:hypothetical protein EVAR_93266_1 [Eumeta japonica]
MLAVSGVSAGRCSYLNVSKGGHSLTAPKAILCKVTQLGIRRGGGGAEGKGVQVFGKFAAEQFAGTANALTQRLDPENLAVSGTQSRLLLLRSLLRETQKLAAAPPSPDDALRPPSRTTSCITILNSWAADTLPPLMSHLGNAAPVSVNDALESYACV